MKKYWKLGRFTALLAVWVSVHSLVSCGGESSTNSNKAIDGKTLYRQHCVICHGADGTLALNGAADLSRSTLSLEERIHQIASGKNTMPPYRGTLKEAEISAVAQYIETLRR